MKNLIYYLVWSNDEMCDVLLIFKAIQLDPNYKNNYKELARRMSDAGWTRDNNQCRQQVNFFLLCKEFEFITRYSDLFV